MRQTLTALLSTLFVSSAMAQPSQPLTLRAQPTQAAVPAWSAPGPRPSHAVHAVVDTAALRAALAEAPLHRPGVPLHTYALTIDLPHPSGILMPCFVAESSILHPALAAKFPQMRTFVVQSADALASGRLELTQRGLSAMLREPADLASVGGTWLIDRWQSGDPSHVIAYWLRDLPNSTDWSCLIRETPDLVSSQSQSPAAAERPITQTRIARLAVACTGEYGLHHSALEGNPPNAADPLAAIVTVVSRSNVVFEADLAVTFQLVANNDQIIHFDPQTDPYPDTCDGSGGANCSSPILGVNRTYVRDTIGSDNFDIGHCVTRIAGGVAYLRSVCGANKAGGISGIPRGGDIDPLSALVVIHEFGHQFGANHTFSGTRGRCADNARLSTAWEAGSGSSPMAYAGGCPVGSAPPSDNIVEFADPFFHHGNILEMQAFLATGNASCLSPISSSNSDPVIVSVTPDLAIPPGTPFTLTATAFDPESDPLSYSWEQSDSGFARPLSGAGSEDNGIGSLFRIFPPVSSPSRTFPQWNDILEAVPTPGEQLPTFTGVTRTFRVLVRDNAPGAGATAISPPVTLEIASGASPFAVISPAENDTLGVGQAQILWSVGSTDLPPISVQSVRIRLSEDDAFTFPHDLGAFPNTGSATISLPALSTASARIRIESEGNIFFALSRPFTLGSCPGDIADDFGTLGADGMVSFGDFLALLGLIGPCPGGTPGCAGDIADNFGFIGPDGMVSFGDFLALLGLIGPCP